VFLSLKTLILKMFTSSAFHNQFPETLLKYREPELQNVFFYFTNYWYLLLSFMDKFCKDNEY
jgi:hypothetical protein